MRLFFYSRYIVLGGSIFLLPGCSTILDWGKKSLYQGIEIRQDYSIPRSYIRSVSAYDQFTTIAHFDCLWLCEPVRMAYVDVYADASGKRGEQKIQLQRLQADELKHFITFYVSVPQEIVLGQTNSLWHLYLSVDDLTFDPIEIKAVELPSVYKCFFGKLFSRFKTIYQVKFEARDLYDNPVILSTTRDLKLHFRMITKEVVLKWQLLPEVGIQKEPVNMSGHLTAESKNEQIRARKKGK